MNKDRSEDSKLIQYLDAAAALGVLFGVPLSVWFLALFLMLNGSN